jgi:hypothetical protein
MSLTLKVIFNLSPRVARLFENYGRDPIRRAIATTARSDLTMLDLARSISRDCVTPGGRVNSRAVEIYNDYFYALPLSAEEVKELTSLLKTELKAGRRQDHQFFFKALMRELMPDSSDHIM